MRLSTAPAIALSSICCFASFSMGGATGEGSVRQAPTPPRENEHYRYVGTKKCRMCHVDQYRSWQDSPKGQSFTGLKPGQAVEVKRRAGLDPGVDYTTDSSCLPCHSVGFGKPGGYVVPDPNDKRSVSQAKAREGAGCEACHGPGSGFVVVMQDIHRNERPYDPQELRAKGRKPVGRDTCQQCHNEAAHCRPTSRVPTDRDPWLTVDPKDRRGYHELFRLRFCKTAIETTSSDREPKQAGQETP